MNNLRTPVIILVIILVAVGAWLLGYRQHTEPTAANDTAQLQQGSTQTPVDTSASGTDSTATSPTPPLDPSTVATNVVGTWQSVDDPNYTVVITADGKWTDKYKGGDASSSVSETGTYKIFTSANPDPGFDSTIVPGTVYTVVKEGKSTLYYSVLEASGTNLQLSYLARGNTLAFVRVQ
ncbi:MAG: hypothetical protein P4L81_05670 [Candidatus Pacebacteria bacterium]|nr:hypothetical protein [Candidatus Paceibacterota bacterium]